MVGMMYWPTQYIGLVPRLLVLLFNLAHWKTGGLLVGFADLQNPVSALPLNWTYYICTQQLVSSQCSLLDAPSTHVSSLNFYWPFQYPSFPYIIPCTDKSCGTRYQASSRFSACNIEKLEGGAWVRGYQYNVIIPTMIILYRNLLYIT